MSYIEIIRALKGKEHGRRLSKEQDAVLPEQSARLVELADAELDAVQGAGSKGNFTVDYGIFAWVYEPKYTDFPD